LPPASKKKCLGIFALAAEFERAEIFEPESLGDVRSCLQPNPELVEVIEADVAVVHALGQMVANGYGDARPGLNLGHLLTENQAAQLVAKALRLFGIARCAKALGKLEKRLLFLFPGFDAELNELHQNTVVTQALAFCHALYLFGDGSGERYAPPDVFCGGHGIIIHQFGATAEGVDKPSFGRPLSGSPHFQLDFAIAID
jgi:hypothetical protein